MSTSKNSGKLAIFALVALIGGAAGFGYFSQATKLSDSEKPAQTTPAAGSEAKPSVMIDATALEVNARDIVLGDAAAPVTIVEYSSLSCPHCAHFHEKILPDLQKEFISTGKAKLVVRYFPLNDPALKGAVTIECAGQNGLSRENFVKVLFDMQAKWAFGAEYLKDLKQIALVGGIDSAAFDSCVNDKDLESRILTARQDAEMKPFEHYHAPRMAAVRENVAAEQS